MIISIALSALFTLIVINMALDTITPPKVEVPLFMTSPSPSPLNYTTIRALWDCFDRFECIFECQIDDLLSQGVITQEDVEQAADELMIDQGCMTIDALNISPDDFTRLLNNWVIYDWSTKPRQDQDAFIELLLLA
jgi:hypothetical protein